MGGGVTQQSLVEQRSLRTRANFSDFKAQFEAKNPDQAKTLQEAIRPRHERLALEAEKQLNLLEKASVESRMPRSSREQLEKYAANVAKQPEVMAYLKQHNPELTEKVRGLAKEHERSRSLDRGIDR